MSLWVGTFDLCSDFEWRKDASSGAASPHGVVVFVLVAVAAYLSYDLTPHAHRPEILVNFLNFVPFSTLKNAALFQKDIASILDVKSQI